MQTDDKRNMPKVTMKGCVGSFGYSLNEIIGEISGVTDHVVTDIWS